MSSLYSIGQMNQLADALEMSGYSPEQVQMLGQEGRLMIMRGVLEGRAKIVPILVEQQPEPVIGSIIRVNRLVKSTYPDWVKEVLHPELEGTGPAEYDVTKVEQWLHDGQKDGKWIKGQKIYEYLKKDEILESCLGLSDLLAIQVKGIAFFRQHFTGKAVFGWKSVVRSRSGLLRAPCLYESGDEVVLLWYWLEDDWVSSDPALRFAS